MKKTKLLSLALIAPLLFSCNADNTINVEELKAFTPTYVQPENKNTGDPVINENGQVVFDFYEISDFHGAVVDDIDRVPFFSAFIPLSVKLLWTLRGFCYILTAESERETPKAPRRTGISRKKYGLHAGCG